MLRINPQHANARDGLAKVELSEAIRSVAEAPSGESYLRLGQVLQQEGRGSQAQAAYEQALDLNPKLKEAHEALKTLTGQSKLGRTLQLCQF